MPRWSRNAVSVHTDKVICKNRQILHSWRHLTKPPVTTLGLSLNFHFCKWMHCCQKLINRPPSSPVSHKVLPKGIIASFFRVVDCFNVVFLHMQSTLNGLHALNGRCTPHLRLYIFAEPHKTLG